MSLLVSIFVEATISKRQDVSLQGFEHLEMLILFLLQLQDQFCIKQQVL